MSDKDTNGRAIGSVVEIWSRSWPVMMSGEYVLPFRVAGRTRRIFVGGSEPMVPVRCGLVTQVAGCSQNMACGLFVTRYSRPQGSGKAPATFPARARTRFTSRSAPSDGTGGGSVSKLDQSIHHRSLIGRNSSLEPTIRLMCDPASSRKR